MMRKLSRMPLIAPVSGSALAVTATKANCDAPAKTTTLDRTAIQAGMPALTAATPNATPNAATASPTTMAWSSRPSSCVDASESERSWEMGSGVMMQSATR